LLIIVEGPDTGGKSFLVEALLKTLPRSVHISMLGGRTKPHEQSRMSTYELLATLNESTIVCERFHAISDRVYRQIDNGERIFTDEETCLIYRRLARRNAVVVYCRPPFARTRKHIAKGDDDQEWMDKVEANFPAIYRAYDFEMLKLHKLGVDVIHHDHTVSWSMDLLLKGLE